jgi:hypothetical protein
MIVLYIPFVTNVGNIGGCSIYNSNTQLLRTWLEADPTLSIIFPVVEGIEYTDFLDHPRIATIEVRDNPNLYGTQQYRRSGFVREELLNRFLGEDPDGLFFDIILNTKPRIAPNIQLTLGSVFGEHPAPLVNYSFFRTSKKDQYYTNVNEAFDRSYSYGMTFGRASFETDEIFRRFKMESGVYISPASVRRVHDRRITNCGAITVSAIEEVIEGEERPKDGPLVVHHAGRLSTSNHSEKILEMIDEVYATGKDVRFVLTSQGSMGRYSRRVINEMKEKGFEGIEIVPQCPQDEFWRTAARSHIRIANTHHGEFYYALAEQIICGLVPIIREASFMKPLWEDYPFSYTTTSDLRVLLNYVMEHYWDDEVQGPFKELRAKVIREFDARHLHLSFIRDCEEYVEESRDTDVFFRGFLELAAQALRDLDDGFSFDDLAEHVKANSEQGSDPRYVQPLNRTTRHDWHRVLGALGYEGTYNKDFELSYTKVRDVDLEVYLTKGES